MKGFKSGFLAIFIGDLYLPVAIICIQREEYRGITKRVDTFVLAMYGVCIQNDYGIRRIVFHTDQKCSVFLIS